MSHCRIFARSVKQWHVDRTERERERERERGESREGGEQLARREVRVRAQSGPRSGPRIFNFPAPAFPCDFALVHVMHLKK